MSMIIGLISSAFVISLFIGHTYKKGWMDGYLQGEAEGSGRDRTNNKEHAKWAWKTRNEFWGK